MLWNAAPDSRRAAQTAIILSAARVMQSIFWTTLPRSTMPGDEWFEALTAIAVGVALTVTLQLAGRSSRS
jgi:hypothetical protein